MLSITRASIIRQSGSQKISSLRALTSIDVMIDVMIDVKSHKKRSQHPITPVDHKLKMDHSTNIDDDIEHVTPQP
jgi:hypothetical protein